MKKSKLTDVKMNEDGSAVVLYFSRPMTKVEKNEQFYGKFVVSTISISFDEFDNLKVAKNRVWADE